MAEVEAWVSVSWVVGVFGCVDASGLLFCHFLSPGGFAFWASASVVCVEAGFSVSGVLGVFGLGCPFGPSFFVSVGVGFGA